MKVSFGTIVPPARKTVTVNAKQPENGAELTLELRAMDIPTAQEAAIFGYEMIRKYVPFEKRKMLAVGKDEKEPVPFPATPTSGVIVLNEQACIECANLYYSQDLSDEANVYSFKEFVWMRTTAPVIYSACQMAMISLGNKEEDLEGNPLAGGGSE